MNPKNRSILIVDDSDMDRDMIKMAFKRNGVNQIIVSVDFGEEAIVTGREWLTMLTGNAFPFPSSL